METEMQKTTFDVDYKYKKPGVTTSARMKRSGSVQITLKTSTSEFAIQNYLQECHPGCEITIMSIKWK